jgi:hypothetical protein
LYIAILLSLVIVSLLLGVAVGHNAIAQPRDINNSLISLPRVPTGCEVQGDGLPDSRCTPGAVNPEVTQDNIHSTICVPGYTKTIRPPTSYTNPLKTKLMDSYGLDGSDPATRENFELDHLIALTVGGNPTSVSNLWPEPYNIQHNAHVKDKFEFYLNKQVCSGLMSLSDAQRALSEDWIASSSSSGTGFIASMIPIPNASFSLKGGEGIVDEDDNAK